MNPTYHKMLLRQIHKTLGDDPTLSPELQLLLSRVSETYAQADADRALIERSLELSSNELSMINKDIEAKVRLRTEELRQEHVRFMSSMNSLGVGFVMCGVADDITMINPAMQRILAGYPPVATDTAKERPVRLDWTFDEVDGMLRPDFQLREVLHRCLASGEKVEYRDLAFGSRALHVFVAPIISSETMQSTQTLGAVLLVEDSTEQTILDRSRSEFFYIASHELRTPLTAIRGNTEIMQKYLTPTLQDSDMVDMINDVHESAVRLIGIVNDFLDVSALELDKMRLEPKAFLLKDLLADINRDLTAILSAKSLALIIDPSVEVAPAVLADQERIKQVLYNLIGNASKFTDQGSVTINARADNVTVTISVTDTGRGMSSEDQQLLFHKFQQAGSSLLTRDTQKGTGLGLYISKLIVEKSGGSIILESSAIGKGSTFVFILPRAVAATVVANNPS